MSPQKKKEVSHLLDMTRQGKLDTGLHRYDEMGMMKRRNNILAVLMILLVMASSMVDTRVSAL